MKYFVHAIITLFIVWCFSGNGAERLALFLLHLTPIQLLDQWKVNQIAYNLLMQTNTGFSVSWTSHVGVCLVVNVYLKI